MSQDPIKELIAALHQDQLRAADLSRLYAKEFGEKPGTLISIKRPIQGQAPILDQTLSLENSQGGPQDSLDLADFYRLPR